MSPKNNLARTIATTSRDLGAELRLRTRLLELARDHEAHLLTVARVHLHPRVHLDEDAVQLVFQAVLRGILPLPKDKQEALSELHHWVAEVARRLREDAPMTF